MVSDPCGSASTSSTFLPSRASPTPRFSQVVILPFPAALNRGTGTVLFTIPETRVCKVFDVNQIGFSQPAPFAFNQSKLFQFPEQFGCLVVCAAQCIHHFLHRKNDIHPSLLIQPSVFHRQPHVVQQDAVQRFGISGQVN